MLSRKLSQKSVKELNVDYIKASNPVDRGITDEKIAILKESIEKIGLINPLILVESNDDKFEIVSGQIRLLALKSSGRKTVKAYILKEDEINSEDVIKYHFSENFGHRGFNLIEISYFVRKLDNSGIKDRDILSTVFSSISLEKSAKTFEMLKNLCKLCAFFKVIVAKGKIPLQSAYEISKLKLNEQELLKQYIEGMKLSLSKIREIVSVLNELSAIRNCTVGEVLNLKELTEILASEKIDKNQKGDKFRKILYAIRNPSINDAKMDYASLIRTLDLPYGISLKDQPGFDDGVIKLEICFNSDSALKERLRSLEAIVAENRFKKILESI